jgi:ATP-dependent Lon protease
VKPYQGLLQFVAGLRKKAADRALSADRKRTAGRGLKKTEREGEELVLLPLKDLVLFPNTTVPVFITHQSGIIAVEESLKRDHRLFASCLLNSKTAAQEADLSAELFAKLSATRPAAQNTTHSTTLNVTQNAAHSPQGLRAGRGGEHVHGPLSPVSGTAVRILQILRLPDGSVRVLLQGEYRGTITGIKSLPVPPAGYRLSGPEDRLQSYNLVRVEVIPGTLSGTEDTDRLAMIRAIQQAFAQYADLSKKIGPDIIAAVERADNPERLVNLIANSMAIKPEKKLELLSIRDSGTRLEAILETLEMESEIYSVQRNISGKVKSRLEKNQREYILHEQLKEINRELGKDNPEDEFADLEKAVAARNPPEEVLVKAQKEIGRLRKLQPFSPEAGVLRAYVEWIRDLPWSEYSPDSVNLGLAEKILDEDHYNMRKAKDRILEFIAVRQLSAAGSGAAGVAGIKGPILCFTGPPGTGKTSLGKSVARALGRTFVRISLGGVRDEAEIRGHRKTYVGALPGKIIQSMRRAGTMNPVFLLDEIDKLSSDFRGDPASALLEVLDPEQNSAFTDHYMEVAYDLSKVLFITTANSLNGIPYPLLDRMEIIEIPGYGEHEKLAIAKQFLVPKELEENSLKDAAIKFTDESLREIIRYWTMESGVRALEREIARILRRIAREAVKKNYGASPSGAPSGAPDSTPGKPLSGFKRTIRPSDLERLLGRRKYKRDVVFTEERVGVSHGLAWTETGGAMLPVETRGFEGDGELIITGNLGDVMKESARIALSWLRSARENYRFRLNIAKTDFHIHVPEGAIPKDGPSAGITLAASLLSTLCQKAPRPGIAMTGELTLTGRILPIGGLKEKLLAAVRNGMEQVILPEGNRDDWEELDRDIREAIPVEFVENAEDAFWLLFGTGVHRKGGLKKGGSGTPVLEKSEDILSPAPAGLLPGSGC